MYRTLLVPLDGSPFGEHALPVALGIARRAGAKLRLAHVHVPYVVADSMAVVDSVVEARLREQEAAYLDAVVQRVKAAADVDVAAALLDGAVADSLAGHAQDVGADLVVVTTHGRGPVSRFWLGSTADRLGRIAPAPVLFLRPQDGALDLGKEAAFRRVLVPLDGSPLAEQALGPARALGSLGDAAYLLLRVVRPTLVPAAPADLMTSGLGRDAVHKLQELDRQVHREAQDYLERVARPLRADGLRVQTRVAAHDVPAAAVTDQARAEGADLIVLNSHGRGGLARLFLGSVADKVLRSAATPVLVSRLPAAEGAGR